MNRLILAGGFALAAATTLQAQAALTPPAAPGPSVLAITKQGGGKIAV